jgi:hypothetical protein
MATSNAGTVESLSGLFGSGSGMQSGTGNISSGLLTLPGMGSNQFMSYPGTPSASPQSGTGNITGPVTLPGGSPAGSGGVGTPGTVPTPGQLPGSSPITNPVMNNGSPLNYIVGAPGSANEVPNTNTYHMVPTYDPGYTQQFYNTMQQLLGTGMPGFNLQTALPGGGTTGAGQLNAPLNSTLQDIQGFLSGQNTSVPGANSLNQMATTGDPVDQTAAWQAMIGSEQQNIQQNQADLKEQFAFGGALGGSEFGNAMQNYEQGVTATQNAQLTQATATAQENAMNRMLSAGQGIQSEANQFGTGLQNLQQGSIQNMLNEFNYTQPQNNPLWQLMGQSAAAAPGTVNTQSLSQAFNNIMSGIGSII